MNQQVSPSRKMFSHSNKVIWTSPGLLPPEAGIRGRIEVSLKEKFRGSLVKLRQEHKYERFIDRLLLQHAHENDLPVITNSLSKKHHYHSCRIVKTEQLEASPEPQKAGGGTGRGKEKTRQREREGEGVRRSHSERKSSEADEVGGLKQKKSLELPLIFKYKGCQSEEQRQQTEQNDMESSRVLKLKELKQNMILKYIRPH